MIDLVIPLGKGSTCGDKEIRWSLRSWAKHYPKAEPIIVGVRPPWYTGRHLPYFERDTLNRNTWGKLRIALEHCGHSLVYSADDIYLTGAPQWGAFHLPESPQRAFYYRKAFPGGRDHELHIPVLFHRDRLREVMDGMRDKRAAIRTTYFRDFPASTPMEDVKIKGAPVGGWCFSSTEDACYSGEFQAYMRDNYSDPSPWER